MLEKLNHDNDCLDPSQEYFQSKNEAFPEEEESYFPTDESLPPHY